MATTQPEIWQTVIDHTTGEIRLRGRMVITDEVDGTTRISRDDMERVEAVGTKWPALNTFLAKLLVKANDGRYKRTDIVFAMPPVEEE